MTAPVPCPVCGDQYAVNKDGTIRRHGLPDQCPGSGTPVADQPAPRRTALRARNRTFESIERLRLADAMSGEYTIQQLAKRWGVTRQAVSVWLRSRDIYPDQLHRDRIDQRRARTAAAAAAQRAAKADALRALDDDDLIALLRNDQVIIDKLGFFPSRDLQTEVWGGVRVGKPSQHLADDVSLAQVVRYLRSAANALGVPVEQVGPTIYDQVAPDLNLPSSQMIFRYCRLLGLTPAEVRQAAAGSDECDGRLSVRSDYEPMSRADALGWFRRFITVSATWTARAYDAWAAMERQAGRVAPTRTTLMMAAGTSVWNEAIAATLSSRQLAERNS